ncbi:zinc finger protein [Macleaya cordata]|uniref:RING-type E3 ubiquitin transferase n=1 Tax=Macleaya cordata TaxID=56857 RepID=A0A200R5E9_MACCD|nr:zinc finger protein [Macleaya cordata]
MKPSNRKVLENHERSITVSLYMPSTYIVTALHPPYAATNKSSSSSTARSNHLMKPTTPNFDSSIALTILVLITAIFFMGFFSVYLRCFAKVSSSATEQAAFRRRNQQQQRQQQITSSSGVEESSSTTHDQHRNHSGLDPSTVGSLPLVLAYNVVTAGGKPKQSVECVVCLSEFQETEMVKMIPFCEHVFHPECIDMWFLSHSSCPICRSTKLFPPSPYYYNSDSDHVNNNNNKAIIDVALIELGHDHLRLVDDHDHDQAVGVSEVPLENDQKSTVVVMVEMGDINTNGGHTDQLVVERDHDHDHDHDHYHQVISMRRTLSCPSCLSSAGNNKSVQLMNDDDDDDDGGGGIIGDRVQLEITCELLTGTDTTYNTRFSWHAEIPRSVGVLGGLINAIFAHQFFKVGRHYVPPI